ncbi:hypothetical protein TGAM01_v211179 [Trichoderma gamsii]|uniref:Uncharacterized protein n=1 Tax=Trichoderma gamsii TaxID=398673 RepID=A0A2P4Z6N1_9HYPO|nr:hypothetical protein TGAM01_v211179 [Trichoderma gamsii]PON19956.1 hypothetical protein TGAM01_v211179 [Trichoderma gamsii]
MARRGIDCILMYISSCWRCLFYIIHISIVGYQNQITVSIEYLYREHH